VIKEDRYGMDYPIFCRQCEPCPAIVACRSGALAQTHEGIVYCNHEACNGCGACADACSYDAINLDPSLKPLICDLCDGKPECVKKCPTGALIFGESEFSPEKPEEVFIELRRRWGIGD
jgi:Fe-S-cluster-containing dehydrogenase component